MEQSSRVRRVKDRTRPDEDTKDANHNVARREDRSGRKPKDQSRGTDACPLPLSPSSMPSLEGGPGEEAESHPPLDKGVGSCSFYGISRWKDGAEFGDGSGGEGVEVCT